jgi:hypothetical protein
MERRRRRGTQSSLRDASVHGLSGAVGRARTRAARRRGDFTSLDDPVAIASSTTPTRARRRALETGFPFPVDNPVTPVRASDDLCDEDDDDDEGNSRANDNGDDDDEEDNIVWDTNVAADAAAAAAVAASMEAEETRKEMVASEGAAPNDKAAHKAAAKERQAQVRLLNRLRTAQALARYQANVVFLCACQLRMDSAANDEELQARALSVTPPDAVLDPQALTLETLRRFALWYRCAFQTERLVEGKPVRRLCDIVERALICLSTRRGEVMDLVVLAAAAIRATSVRCRIVVPMQLLSFKVQRSAASMCTGRKITETVADYAKPAGLYGWLEVFLDGRWTHADALFGLVDAANAGDIEKAVQSIDGTPSRTSGRTRGTVSAASIEAPSISRGKQPRTMADVRAHNKVHLHSGKISIAHVVAAENSVFTDVTLRYVRSWSEADKARPPGGLFEKTLVRCSDCLENASPGQEADLGRTLSNGAEPQSSTVLGIPASDSATPETSGNDEEAVATNDSPSNEGMRTRDRIGGRNPDAAKSSEQREFDSKSLGDEIPTTITALRTHPLYCIERHLRKYEVVFPREPMLGYVGLDNEPVFLRSHVRLLHTRERWLREMRKVLEDSEPIKNVKSRTKYDTMDGKDADLFGDWQTVPLVIPACHDGIVPKNERGNVELWTPAHLPKGGVHVPLLHAASAARQLGFDFAPCMTGFEIRSGRSVPRIEGVVVAAENADVVQDAALEAATRAADRAENRAREEALGNWKDLIRRVAARQRVRQKYGGMFDEEEDGTYEAIQKRRGEKLRREHHHEPGTTATAPMEEAMKNLPVPDSPPKRRKMVDAHDHQFDDGRQHEGDVWIKTCTICQIEVAYERL